VSHLLREHAPITEAGWELLDSEARERLQPALAARRLIDFAGPRGWRYSATNLGRTKPLADAPGEGLTAAQRQVLPLTEVRADFAISRAELEDADRGAEDIELGPLDEAAHRIAFAENAAVFHGWSAAGISGIAEASPHTPIELGDDCDRYPRHVAKAIEALLEAGVGGPYGLALGPEAHTNVLETSEHAAATSSSSPAKTSRSATPTTTSTPSASIWRRASASASPPLRLPYRLPRPPQRRDGSRARTRVGVSARRRRGGRPPRRRGSASASGCPGSESGRRCRGRCRCRA
jgi:uncharacterized linocin/CFP29 family protein